MLDYSSLYPSSMIERNLSHDCYVAAYTPGDPFYTALEAEGIRFVTVTHDVYEGLGDKKHKTGEKACTFAQLPEGRKGIIPTILQSLIQQRKNTRKKIEYETVSTRGGGRVAGLVTRCGDGDLEVLDVEQGVTRRVAAADVDGVAPTYGVFEQAVLDALQVAYKVTANSLYGQIGSRTSPIYWKDIAASTTATGRERIMQAKAFVEAEYGAEVIYGDTDSIFCRFPTLDPATGAPLSGLQALPLAIAAGQRASRDIKAHLPPPQSLEYEKTMYPFILFSKKRYCGLLYEDDATKAPKMKSMGIVMKRRDNAPVVKTVYGGILEHLLTHQDLDASIGVLREQLAALVEGRTPLEELVVAKTLRGHYKNPQQIAHKVLADRMGERDAGNKPQANDRIPYVYFVPPDGAEVRLQGERIETPDYIRAHGLKPDYRHYITHQIMTPVCQLYALCVERLPGYAFGPGYWAQMEEEVATGKRVPKKIKDKITALKMKVVEALLFAPYLEQLESVRIAKKPVKKKATAAQSALADAVRQVADAGGGLAVDARRRLSDPLVVTIRLVEETKPRRYTGTVTIFDGAETWPLPGTPVEYKPQRGSPLNKTFLGAQLAAKAMNHVLESHKAVASRRGLRFDVERVVKSAWEKAYDMRDRLRDDMEAAVQVGDIDALSKLNVLVAFDFLVGALSGGVLAYDFV